MDGVHLRPTGGALEVPTDDSGAQVRFLGAVVSSELVVGVFFDSLLISEDKLELRPLGRRDLSLDRAEVEAVEFERQWALPFWFKTVIRFRGTDGTYAPKVMVAFRTAAVREALLAAGWRVRQVQFGSTESAG